MTECALGITELLWREWVEAAGNLNAIRQLECPGTLLGEAELLLGTAAREGLAWTAAHGLIPSAQSRYLAESSLADKERVHEGLAKALRNAADLGMRYVTLDLGLDRIGLADAEEGLRVRCGLVRALLDRAPPEGISVCAEMREPAAFPRSHEQPYAGNIVYEVQDPRCALCANVCTAELASDYDIDRFLRHSVLHLAMVRFLYAPFRGEDLDEAGQARWAEALHRFGFRGIVVFCPQVDDAGACESAATMADGWARLYE